MGFLRFLFALAVVIEHSRSIFGYELIPGRLAVQSFYMISGFYMALVLNEKYIEKNNSYKLFISSRLLRLFPTYWVVLLCVLLYSVITLFLSRAGASWDDSLNMFCTYWNDMSLMTIIFLIFTNIFIFFQDLVMFLGLDVDTGNLFFTSNFWKTSPHLYLFLFVPQAWTIALELFFYFCAPFLVRRKLLFISVLIFISLSIRIYLVSKGYSNDPWNYRFFPNELALFLFGVVAYRIYSKIKSTKINKALPIFLFSIVLIFTFSYTSIDLYGKYVLFLAVLFIALPYLFLWTKNMSYDRMIGELSYPIYICHMFVLSIVTALDLSIYGNRGLIICIGSIIFAILLNKVIEIPLDKYRQRRLIRKQN